MQLIRFISCVDKKEMKRDEFIDPVTHIGGKRRDILPSQSRPAIGMRGCRGTSCHYVPVDFLTRGKLASSVVGLSPLFLQHAIIPLGVSRLVLRKLSTHRAAHGGSAV